MKLLASGLLGLAALSFAPPASAATNIFPGHVTSITVTGSDGVLRIGSPWGPGSTPSDQNTPVDGAFVPEQTQWNNTSFWWDEDSSVNQSKVYWEVLLDQAFTVDQFIVQADDNDSYLLEYWDGAAWQTAFDIPTLPSFGLVTRDSGTVGPIMTDRFRFSATGGDNYFAVSEIQAFAIAVPELSVWAMMIIGFGAMGGLLRRQRIARPSFV